LKENLHVAELVRKGARLVFRGGGKLEIFDEEK